MELKDYQQTVVNDLTEFLEYVEKFEYVGKAFNEFWRAKGVKQDAYKHNVKGAPHVCAKVPTAGGKTFIAVNALRPIFESFARRNPLQTRAVVWLVPSITILDQTIKNLSDPAHPYNLKLKTHFNGRVEVFDKKQILQGAGFNADAVREQLSIIVLSFDSLRARNKEDRKLYQDNGNLNGFGVDAEDVSAISVIQSLKPVVVVDESHNAETDLSVEMLQDLNPSFILDLTATPRNNSNIISYIDARALKKNNMVKLPVVVQNQRDKADVIQNALHFRQQLEAAATAEEARGGGYIRPIVLFQAEPRNAADAATFQDVKDKLVKLGIPGEQIKIKTADKNELKDVDLTARDCPVRFIITVNALKEGWDCSFAYILASLANKSSAIDVEQILGRVLRQPNTRRHNDQLLNMSYVFTASSKFLETVNQVVKGLQQAGFSNRDYRVAESAPEFEDAPAFRPTQILLPDFNQPAQRTDEPEDEIDVAKINLTETAPSLEKLKADALAADAEFTKQIEAETSELPLELAGKTNIQPMKENFAEPARKLELPQFFIKLPAKQNGFFDTEDLFFNSDELLDDFKLSRQDTEIDFETLDSETYVIDLEDISKDDYKPAYRKLNRQQVSTLNEKILSLPAASKIEAVNARFCKLIGNLYPIEDREVKRYVNRILEQMPVEQLKDCLERDFLYSARIKRKINDLATSWKQQKFVRLLDSDKIIVKPNYVLPAQIAPTSSAPAVQKSLYVHESSMNNFETAVINAVANLENVRFWHKIVERKGFHINGFVNHYPDFLVLTKNNKILLIESKGDDRDNSDSKRKLDLGKIWASKAGREYAYFMIFDNNPIENAYKFDDAIKIIATL